MVEVSFKVEVIIEGLFGILIEFGYVVVVKVIIVLFLFMLFVVFFVN